MRRVIGLSMAAAVGGLGTFFAIGLFSPVATAVPAFARKTGLACSGCHEVWPRLNDFGQLFRDRAQAMGTTPEQERANALAKDGLRRVGRPEDVAELALFLCSERARHIQGAAIAVDGGQTTGLF